MRPMFRTTSAAVILTSVLVLADGADAGKNMRRTKLRPDTSAETAAVRPARGIAKLKARREQTVLKCRFRGLEPDTDYAVYCDAIGDEPLTFKADHRGRARLSEVPAPHGERGDPVTVEVRADDGSVLLHGELEHPGHRENDGQHHADHESVAHHEGDAHETHPDAEHGQHESGHEDAPHEGVPHVDVPHDDGSNGDAAHGTHGGGHH